jgi:hypothetical protein
MSSSEYVKEMTMGFEENLKALSDEYKLAKINTTFEYIENLLGSLSEGWDSQEPETNPELQSALLKVITLGDLISKSAEEFVSLDILKELLAGETNIFQGGKSVKIETLEDGTLRISAADN